VVERINKLVQETMENLSGGAAHCCSVRADQNPIA
jgi:hypothetical protein